MGPKEEKKQAGSSEGEGEKSWFVCSEEACCHHRRPAGPLYTSEFEKVRSAEVAWLRERRCRLFGDAGVDDPDKDNFEPLFRKGAI